MRFLLGVILKCLLCGTVFGDSPTPWVVTIPPVQKKNCICGADCKCGPGECPGKCPLVIPVTKTEIKRVQICENGRCRIVELNPTFTAPGYGMPPPGLAWYKTLDGKYHLYQIPK